MMLLRLTLATLTIVLPVNGARADVCSDHISGEPALVDAVSALLAARSVDCSGLYLAISRRDGMVVLATAEPSAAPVERLVADIATAATVVESWGRPEIVAPLLEARAVPPSDPGPIIRERAIVAPAPTPATRGVQLFAAAETTFASDRTTWLGVQLGACIPFGPVCVAVRARFDEVTSSPWQGVDRHSAELLVGLDVPIRFHGLVATPGFGGGVGKFDTYASGLDLRMGNEAGGLRADVHATISIPLGPRLAVDVLTAVELTQATDTKADSPMPLPGEPRVLFRLGAGLRYGGL